MEALFDFGGLNHVVCLGAGDMKENRYFFCKRRRDSMNKFTTTDCGGYWKSSGKERQIMAGGSNHVIGIKKSFAFYQGRKLKTQWILQEFTLVGCLKTPFLHQVCVDLILNHYFINSLLLLLSSSELEWLMSLQRLLMQVGDWVVCRLFERKRRARNHGKNESRISPAETTSSASSGITEISSSDLDQEASS